MIMQLSLKACHVTCEEILALRLHACVHITPLKDTIKNNSLQASLMCAFPGKAAKRLHPDGRCPGNLRQWSGGMLSPRVGSRQAQGYLSHVWQGSGH